MERLIQRALLNSKSDIASPPNVYDNVSRKTARSDVVCKICNDGSTSLNDKIIPCANCYAGYHQNCHQPNIGSSMLQINYPWICSGCHGDVNCFVNNRTMENKQEHFTESQKKRDMEIQERTKYQRFLRQCSDNVQRFKTVNTRDINTKLDSSNLDQKHVFALKLLQNSEVNKDTFSKRIENFTPADILRVINKLVKVNRVSPMKKGTGDSFEEKTKEEGEFIKDTQNLLDEELHEQKPSYKSPLPGKLDDELTNHSQANPVDNCLKSTITTNLHNDKNVQPEADNDQEMGNDVNIKILKIESLSAGIKSSISKTDNHYCSTFSEEEITSVGLGGVEERLKVKRNKPSDSPSSLSVTKMPPIMSTVVNDSSFKYDEPALQMLWNDQMKVNPSCTPRRITQDKHSAFTHSGSLRQQQNEGISQIKNPIPQKFNHHHLATTMLRSRMPANSKSHSTNDACKVQKPTPRMPFNRTNGCVQYNVLPHHAVTGKTFANNINDGSLHPRLPQCNTPKGNQVPPVEMFRQMEMQKQLEDQKQWISEHETSYPLPQNDRRNINEDRRMRMQQELSMQAREYFKRCHPLPEHFVNADAQGIEHRGQSMNKQRLHQYNSELDMRIDSLFQEINSLQNQKFSALKSSDIHSSAGSLNPSNSYYYHQIQKMDAKPERPVTNRQTYAMPGILNAPPLQGHKLESQTKSAANQASLTKAELMILASRSQKAFIENGFSQHLGLVQSNHRVFTRYEKEFLHKFNNQFPLSKVTAKQSTEFQKTQNVNNLLKRRANDEETVTECKRRKTPERIERESSDNVDKLCSKKQPLQLQSHRSNSRSPLTLQGAGHSKEVLIMTDMPVEKQPSRKTLCHVCSEEAKFYCSGCRSIRYCSKKCQLSHWKEHVQGCKKNEQC